MPLELSLLFLISRQIAVRSYQKGDVPYMKLVLDRAGAHKGGLFGLFGGGRKKETAGGGGRKAEED